MDPLGAPAPGLDRVGRDGHLRLRFERRGAATAVTRSRWTLPLQVLAPLALDDPAAVVSVLNPTGGLVGGDRLDIEVEVGPDAHACLTTPSATKVYRSAEEDAVQEVVIRAAPGATVEWVPDHAIPFAGSAFRQRIDVEVEAMARLVLVDAFAAGRVARGERWRFRTLDSAIRVRDAKGWLLLDRMRLAPGGRELDGLGLTDGAPYVATVVVIGEEPLDAFGRAVGEGTREARLGVALLPRRGALVRCLAVDAPALARAVSHVWAAARRTILGRPPLDLRKP